MAEKLNYTLSYRVVPHAEKMQERELGLVLHN